MEAFLNGSYSPCNLDRISKQPSKWTTCHPTLPRLKDLLHSQGYKEAVILNPREVAEQGNNVVVDSNEVVVAEEVAQRQLSLLLYKNLNNN